MTLNNEEMQNNYLGEGIIIGLLYGIGAFIGAWNKNSKLALIGGVFFVIAYFYHKHILNKIEKHK